jgi:hypothetical protein
MSNVLYGRSLISEVIGRRIKGGVRGKFLDCARGIDELWNGSRSAEVSDLFEPAGFLDRVRRYCAEQIERKAMPKGAFEVLREVILFGPLSRAKVTEVTGYKERQARSIVSRLIELELLTADSPRAPLRLHIPHAVVSAWFPRLYPG